MKNNFFKIYINLFIAFGLLLSSCIKKIEIPNTNQATVTLNSGPNFVTTDISVNPKDSITFSYTVTSEREMKYVGIQKNAVDNSTFIVGGKDTLTSANKNSYSSVKKLAADSASGVYKFRIVALDVAGLYIGSKEVIVTVNSDYNYYTVRVLQQPDTTAKTNNCYLASSTGNVYSYTSGASKSGDIDMGFYYDTTVANKFTVYALSLPQVQLSYNDITSWTKNATIMKKATTPTFASLLSAGGLRSAAVTNLSSGATNKVTLLASGNLVFFKTASGKSGCLQINYINGTNEAKTSYANVDVKIEK